MNHFYEIQLVKHYMKQLGCEFSSSPHSLQTNNEKFCLITSALYGHVGVGKTNYVKFIQGDIQEDFMRKNNGIDFAIKTMHVLGEDFKLQIFDTIGERWIVKGVSCRQTFERSKFDFFCFSIENRNSFENVKVWHSLALEKNNTLIPILLGIHLNTPNSAKREVEFKEAFEFARIHLNGEMY
nr:unnamed protein product [Naegleria fowleri]